jgi:hypothetical protein
VLPCLIHFVTVTRTFLNFVTHFLEVSSAIFQWPGAWRRVPHVGWRWCSRGEAQGGGGPGARARWAHGEARGMMEAERGWWHWGSHNEAWGTAR